MSTPRNWIPWPAYLAASVFNPGCSLRQGPHQAAQKTRTVRDALKSTISADPSSVSPESLGAAVPTRPLGAACETSGCRLHPASSNTRRNQGPRPSKLVDRAGLGAAQGSLKPEAGRRTGFGDVDGRDMEVKEMILEEAGLQSELERVGPRLAHGRPRRLLHDFADLPGQGELAPPLHQDRLDGHDVATVLVDGHAGDRPDLVFQLGDAELEARRPKVAHHVSRLHGAYFGPTFGDVSVILVCDVSDLA